MAGLHAAPDPTRALQIEQERVKTLVEDLRVVLGDDGQALVDTLEGESNLFEALDKVLDSIDDDEEILVGIAAREEALGARKARIKQSRDLKRSIIERTLLMIGEKTVRRPCATLSLAEKPVGVIVIDESLIPPRFFKEQPRPDPKLDKRALLAALKGDPENQVEPEQIEGATLDNGGYTLNIRRK